MLRRSCRGRSLTKHCILEKGMKTATISRGAGATEESSSMSSSPQRAWCYALIGQCSCCTLWKRWSLCVITLVLSWLLKMSSSWMFLYLLIHLYLSFCSSCASHFPSVSPLSLNLSICSFLYNSSRLSVSVSCHYIMNNTHFLSLSICLSVFYIRLLCLFCDLHFLLLCFCLAM